MLYFLFRMQISLLFKSLKMIDQVEPTLKNYENALVLGATIQSMRSRLQYLASLVDCYGIQIKNIYFLAGKRELNP